MREEEANVARLRDRYAAWQASRGDGNVWYDLFADEIEWSSVANGRPGLEFTRPRRSRAEVVGYFQTLAQNWRMEFYRVNEFVAQGPRVVAIGECCYIHRRTRRRVATPKIDIWRFEGGRAVQFMEHFDTQAVLEASRA